MTHELDNDTNVAIKPQPADLPRLPQWYNARFRLPLPVRWPFGNSQISRIIGFQIGPWFIGGIKGRYSNDRESER